MSDENLEPRFEEQRAGDYCCPNTEAASECQTIQDDPKATQQQIQDTCDGAGCSVCPGAVGDPHIFPFYGDPYDL